MFLGKDTKYKSGAVQGDTGLIAEEGKRVEDRTIIFIRHGESTWNQTFNPGVPPIKQGQPSSRAVSSPNTRVACSGHQQTSFPLRVALCSHHGGTHPASL
jgi:hypothetical protein